MKKRNLFTSFIMMFAVVLLTVTSCKEDDPIVTPPVTGVSDSTLVSGNIAGTYGATDGSDSINIYLVAENTYTLDGALEILDGASLTIPAGTKITAANGTTSYIIIGQGGKIFINGTAGAPVVMTSDVADYGQWGGLVVCGNAPVNTGDGLSEVGNLPYGGTDAADNSGTIEYLRVEYTGYEYNSEKQFNGVSFFGVGSGTTVDYVSSYMGKDDGLEFFGGAVNASHIVSIQSQDDGIDFADGWAGTGAYWYSKDSKKSGIEGSNNGKNGAATPMTNATIKNITIVGMGEKPWFLKEGAGMQEIDNVVIGGLTNLEKAPYFYISSDDTDAKAHAAAGEIKITNVNFIDVADEYKWDASLVSISENASATGAGNGADEPTWAIGWATPE